MTAEREVSRVDGSGGPEITEGELTPSEAARWAARAGLPLTADRHAPVAAGAEQIGSLLALLRELDLDDVPPAVAPRAGEDLDDAL